MMSSLMFSLSAFGMKQQLSKVHNPKEKKSQHILIVTTIKSSEQKQFETDSNMKNINKDMQLLNISNLSEIQTNIKEKTMLQQFTKDVQKQDLSPRLTKRLDFSFENMGTQAVRELFKNNYWSNCTALILNTNNIGDSGAILLSEELQAVPNLAILYLYKNNIGEEGAISISNAFEYVPHLTTLHFYNNPIGDVGAKAISKNLTHIPKLDTLNLSCSGIGDAGAIALSQRLVKVSNLMILDLSSNDISDTGAIVLSNSFKDIQYLATINFEFNEIGNAGAIAISQNLKYLPHLNTLKLKFNDIDRAAATIKVSASKEIKCLEL